MWDSPVPATRRAGGLHPERLAARGVLTAGSGQAYDLGYTYQNNGANVNMTGSPDYGGRIVYLGDPGSGCSDNQYAQFNAAAVTGPQPGSVGMESGRNILRGCADKRVDLSLARDIRLGGNRRLQFRVDVFNAFNAVIITERNSTVTFEKPGQHDGREQSVQRGRLAQPGALEAEQRRLRRRDRRPGDAQRAAAAPLPVLTEAACAQLEDQGGVRPHPFFLLALRRSPLDFARDDPERAQRVEGSKTRYPRAGRRRFFLSGAR